MTVTLVEWGWRVAVDIMLGDKQLRLVAFPDLLLLSVYIKF